MGKPEKVGKWEARNFRRFRFFPKIIAAPFPAMLFDGLVIGNRNRVPLSRLRWQTDGF
jgi:hypothetical protein